MANKSISWRNRSPGDFSILLEEVFTTSIEPVIEQAVKAARDWAKVPLTEKKELLMGVRGQLEGIKEELAMGISLEMGKPLREARGEVDAVLAKFELTFKDADRFLNDIPVPENLHPALVRRRPRGPAVVIGPFNFPIHLANGAIIPHLMAGNPVIFKPSPLAAVVASKYSRVLSKALPPGVFQCVQGGADEGWRLSTHPKIRSVAFTGSVPVGRKLATALAVDLSKELALELGGKNAVLVCEDADHDLAAQAVAESLCLTAGQRCNSTSRVIVDRTRLGAFLDRLHTALASYLPGDPMDSETRLGPLVNAAAVERYEHWITNTKGKWILPGKSLENVKGKKGNYVTPAVVLWENSREAMLSTLFSEEAFAPILGIVPVSDETEAIQVANATRFGLTASVFTASESRFYRLSEDLEVGNVYANLPTTFSPSTLPFGGWKDSGNGRPGGQGFLRYLTDEQAVQVKKDAFKF